MTVFETMQEEEIKILTPLFPITYSWLQAFIWYKPLDSSGRGDTVLEAWAHSPPAKN